MSSLRALLKSGRISKRKPPSPFAPRKPTAPPKKQPSAGTASTTAKRKPATAPVDDLEDFFNDHLDSIGLVSTLAADSSLRDVPQAMARARSHMFSPVPREAAGMSSTRIAQVLNHRLTLPPVVSIAHVHALLSASPSAVEREIAELEGSGVVRRIRVRARGEGLILMTDYEKMIRGAKDLKDGTKEWFLNHLVKNPREGIIAREAIRESMADELIRAGFLTGRAGAGEDAAVTLMGLYARPEDRSTLTSLDSVARQASGSLAAVGGAGVIHLAGGGGGARLTRGYSSEMDYSVAVPGHGPLLKLVSESLEHLTWVLSKTKFGEMPESMLRERWDGGIAMDEARLARKSRGEFAGVLPGRTKKWKEFWGVEFSWALEEAMGVGLVEVFETGTVGRGVRKL
ncbi:serine-threonine protein kinase 19-domain-containing protein [Plectosphaerella plurivora]|uniref:Serine-threonine protein kinase 19-domain-containing protein n=1 Tax=Plectosphaerella plurivora TaxID=936078 RepID=A0A9P9A809_9PEZI|nr:serine-threonine protein kinase 19-domain-containing protein [Plectosphaerella plurivora]